MPPRHRSNRLILLVLAAVFIGAVAGTAATLQALSPSANPPATSAGTSAGASGQRTASKDSPDAATAKPRTVLPAVVNLAGSNCDAQSVPTASPVPAAAVAIHAETLHVPILMYHRIVPIDQAGDSLRGLVVPPDLFAAQMSRLAAAGWHTITVAALANDLQAGVQPAPKTFAITFDDGYADGYQYALPILQAHGFVATYFIIPGRIDHPEFLSTSQVQALAAAGDEIANHTMKHVDLNLQTPAQLQWEIDGASQTLARLTGRWPESLAYPFGDFDLQVVGAVSACSPLHIAVTTVEGVSESWVNRFETPRMRVGPEMSADTLLAMVRRWQ